MSFVTCTSECSLALEGGASLTGSAGLRVGSECRYRSPGLDQTSIGLMADSTTRSHFHHPDLVTLCCNSLQRQLNQKATLTANWPLTRLRQYSAVGSQSVIQSTKCHWCLGNDAIKPSASTCCWKNSNMRSSDGKKDREKVSGPERRACGRTLAGPKRGRSPK
jgi:hypothetical protein